MKYLFTFSIAISYLVTFGQHRVSDSPSSRAAASPTGFNITELDANLISMLDSLIIGGCVQVSNFEVHGAPHAFGVFADSVNAIGINSGALLTTGKAGLAVGPDSSNTMGLDNNMLGYPDLNQIAGASTWDAAWIEFDFTPLADTIFASDFVFGSEEYPEYVFGGYNDAFGFFISGPGISGPYSDGAENIAWIPNTTVPIAIDNVNNGYSATEPATGPCTNCQYYVDNTYGPYVQYDAFTTVMHLEYPVIPGETYHFVVAIADAGDGSLDSGVFIESESFCGNTWFQLAQFVAQPQGGYEYQFQNMSQQADSYLWEFGDGTVSTDVNPLHTYAQPGDYEVSLTCTNMCFDTTTTVLLNVGTLTSIEELNQVETTISNVGLDAVSVKGELGHSAPVSLSIMDMTGKVYWSESVGITSRFTQQVNISELKSGLYLMRIDAGKNTSVERFVKL